MARQVLCASQVLCDEGTLNLSVRSKVCTNCTVLTFSRARPNLQIEGT